MQISSTTQSQTANTARKQLEDSNTGTKGEDNTPQPAARTTTTPEQRENEYNQLMEQDRASSQSRSGGGEDISVSGPLPGAGISGGDLGDNIRVNSAIDNTILGKGGNDVIEVSGGDSVIDGGAGGDFIGTVGDKFEIFGGRGGDYIGTDGTRNVVYAGDEGDTIESKGKNNTLYGMDDGDTIVMEDEQSWAFGGNDDDTITDRGLNNASYGEDGDDTINITGQATNGSAFGGDGEDTINMDGDHYADGGDGNDTINSVNGSGSQITGGNGFDTLNLDINWSPDFRFDPAPGTTGESFILSNNAGDTYSITEIERVNFADGTWARPNSDGEWVIFQSLQDDRSTPTQNVTVENDNGIARL